MVVASYVCGVHKKSEHTLACSRKHVILTNLEVKSLGSPD